MKPCFRCAGSGRDIEFIDTDRGRDDRDADCLECEGTGETPWDPRNGADRAEVAALFVDAHGPLVALDACGLRVPRTLPKGDVTFAREQWRTLAADFGTQWSHEVAPETTLEHVMRAAVAIAAVDAARAEERRRLREPVVQHEEIEAAGEVVDDAEEAARKGRAA